MAADGSLISITVRAVLKEWASDSEITPAASLVDFPLIGIVTASTRNEHQFDCICRTYRYRRCAERADDCICASITGVSRSVASA